VSPYSKQFALKEKRVNRAIARMDKVKEPKIKTIGSQRRESLATTDFELAGKKGKEVILRDKETGVHELWVRNDSHAGYTIDIGGKGYEFAREVKDVTKLESLGVKAIHSNVPRIPFSTKPTTWESSLDPLDKEEVDALNQDDKEMYWIMRMDYNWNHDKAIRKIKESKLKHDPEDLMYQEAAGKSMRISTIDELHKAIPPDEWEIPKRPHWHKDPGDEEAEGIRARATYEKKEMERPSGKVKPFARVRRGKAEYVRGHERKTHGGFDPKYTGDIRPKVKAKLEEWGRSAVKRMKTSEGKKIKVKVAPHLQRPPISNLKDYKRLMNIERKRESDEYAGTGSTGGMFP
jgi:hypothetical protein